MSSCPNCGSVDVTAIDDDELTTVFRCNDPDCRWVYTDRYGPYITTIRSKLLC